jgi:hypothetical protein
MILALPIPPRRFSEARAQQNPSRYASAEVRQELWHVCLPDHVVDHGGESRIRAVRRRAPGVAPRQRELMSCLRGPAERIRQT